MSRVVGNAPSWRTSEASFAITSSVGRPSIFLFGASPASRCASPIRAQCFRQSADVTPCFARLAVPSGTPPFAAAGRRVTSRVSCRFPTPAPSYTGEPLWSDALPLGVLLPLLRLLLQLLDPVLEVS